MDACPYRSFLVSCVLALLAFGTAQAQTLPRLTGAPGAYYLFAESGDITVQVSVWGTVANPGLYELREGTHLSTLLSLAGGPRLPEISRRRAYTLRVRLIRDGQTVLERLMQDQLIVGEEDPALRDGDVLTVEALVEERDRFTWRDVFPIISTAASLVLILERLLAK